MWKAMSNNDETLLEFPCDFPIKVMGEASDAFVEEVWELVRIHAPEIERDQLTVRNSSSARYMAVTVVINAQSQEQLDNLYRELTACERVVMAL